MHQALHVDPKSPRGARGTSDEESQDGDETMHYPLEITLAGHSAVRLQLPRQIQQRVFLCKCWTNTGSAPLGSVQSLRTFGLPWRRLRF